jgi:hypothetical protein
MWLGDTADIREAAFIHGWEILLEMTEAGRGKEKSGETTILLSTHAISTIQHLKNTRPISIQPSQRRIP